MNQPEHRIDLDAYLARIGWTGSLRPDLDTLARLVGQHTGAIAFENLSSFLGRPVPLDLASVERKLVHEGRGGYCFEQNLLLWDVLKALGFETGALAARVVSSQSERLVTARSHMLLKVRLEDADYIVDAGFGGNTPTTALRLTAGSSQATAHEPFMLAETPGQGWTLSADVRGQWQPLYRFDLQPQWPIDYIAANYYVSSHPDSHFVQHLKAARPAKGLRYALLDREFAVHNIGGPTQRRTLQDADELHAVLEEQFLIRVPADMRGQFVRLFS